MGAQVLLDEAVDVRQAQHVLDQIAAPAGLVGQLDELAACAALPDRQTDRVDGDSGPAGVVQSLLVLEAADLVLAGSSGGASSREGSWTSA